MLNKSDPFDLANLRIDPERVRQPAKRKNWRREFVRVPWQWLDAMQAAECAGSTYRLAMLLLYEHWRLGGRPIVLSNVSALSEGLPARTKWRALGELERLGMVEVRRHPRRAPRIFLRHTKREPS